MREEPGLDAGVGGRVSARSVPRAAYVVVHGLDEGLDALELHHPAQPVDEGDLDLDAVELEVVAVEDVGLHAAVPLAVEGRVGADARSRRGSVSPVSSRVSQPAYTPSAGARVDRRDRDVGRRVAQLAAALVALDDGAADGERSAQRLRRAGDVTGGQALADVGRAPHLRSAVERARPRSRSRAPPRPRRSVATSPAALAPKRKLAPTTTARGVQRVDEDPVDELLRRPGRDLAVEGDHQDRVDAGAPRAAGRASRSRSGSAGRARAAAPPSGAGRRSPPRPCRCRGARRWPAPRASTWGARGARRRSCRC